MRVIAIVGSGSGSGKTHCAAGLIRLLSAAVRSAAPESCSAANVNPGDNAANSAGPVAALKITPWRPGKRHPLPYDPATPFVLHTDDRHIRVPGKDTGRLGEAGANPVAWLIASEDGLEPGIAQALAHFDATGARVLVVEGNAYLMRAPAHAALFVYRTETPVREHVRHLLPSCTHLAINTPPNTGARASAELDPDDRANIESAFPPERRFKIVEGDEAGLRRMAVSLARAAGLDLAV